MAERKSLMGSRSRLSRILRQQPIAGIDRAIANTHETNRQSAVKEILVHVFFMAKFGLIDRDLVVGEARAQYFTATGIQQAAHCSPGQLFYQTRPIQDHLSASDELHVGVENLFGKTDAIDSKFNKADSRAEENGLREALGAAAIRVANSAKTMRFNRTSQIQPFLASSFGLYKSLGVQAYRAAAVRQRVLMRRRDPADAAVREETIAILNAYADCLSSSMETLETVQGLFLEDVWRQYQAVR